MGFLGNVNVDQTGLATGEFFGEEGAKGMRYSLTFVSAMSQDLFIRQCAGFLKTPPLWVREQFGIAQFEFPEIDFRPVKADPVTKKLRLGHQMESVFKQLILGCKTHELLLHNLPITRGKQTLGEIDFILRDATVQRIVHVELTYKFYLIDTAISEPIHRLMGPNRRDMFFTKMEKIKNEQFQLLHTPEAIHALRMHKIPPDEIVHQACFKAQLFSPYRHTTPSIRPLNPECIGGHWLRFDDFNSSEFKGYQYFIPHKSQWVVLPHRGVNWSTHYEVLLDINLRMIKKSSPMLWVKKSETLIEKLFVVWW